MINQNNYNFEHSGYDIKYDEIKILFEKKEINNIIHNNPNIFLLKIPNIKNIMSSSIDIGKSKDNLKNNINNVLKRLRIEEPDDISQININDNKFSDIEKENIIIYKDLNILFLSKIAKIAFKNNQDIFLDPTFKSCNNLYNQLTYKL